MAVKISVDELAQYLQNQDVALAEYLRYKAADFDDFSDAVWGLDLDKAKIVAKYVKNDALQPDVILAAYQMQLANEQHDIELDRKAEHAKAQVPDADRLEMDVNLLIEQMVALNSYLIKYEKIIVALLEMDQSLNNTLHIKAEATKQQQTVLKEFLKLQQKVHSLSGTNLEIDANNRKALMDLVAAQYNYVALFNSPQLQGLLVEQLTQQRVVLKKLGASIESAPPPSVRSFADLERKIADINRRLFFTRKVEVDEQQLSAKLKKLLKQRQEVMEPQLSQLQRNKSIVSKVVYKFSDNTADQVEHLKQGFTAVLDSIDEAAKATIDMIDCVASEKFEESQNAAFFVCEATKALREDVRDLKNSRNPIDLFKSTMKLAQTVHQVYSDVSETVGTKTSYVSKKYNSCKQMAWKLIAPLGNMLHALLTKIGVLHSTSRSFRRADFMQAEKEVTRMEAKSRVAPGTAYF